MKKIIIISLGILLLLTTSLVAQQSDSLEIHKIKGKEYYIHVVSKGESLYAIHKKYEVPIDVIKSENPSVNDGLSIGEKIFIPVNKHQEEPSYPNGNLIQHKVLAKQTLYSIAKIYNVSVKEIIAANPNMSEKIEEDQLINIPVKQIKQEKDKKDTNTLIKPSGWKVHQVKKGETLYSLSKLYEVSIDSIKIVNNGLTEGLKENEKIFIPIKQNRIGQFQMHKDTLSANLKEILQQAFDSTEKNHFTIALMLPFYVEQNKEITENLNALEDKTIYPKSRFAIEFYNGFLFALDSISTPEKSFEVLVYDTNGDDSLRIQKILKQIEDKPLDLIVGPLYRSNYEVIAQYGKRKYTPVVSPVKQPNKLLLGNEMAFKAIPSQANVVECISTLLVDSFKTANIIALEHASSPEKSLIESLHKAYKNKMLLNIDDTLAFTPINKLKIDKNFADLVAKFSPTKNNVIFIPSSKQAYITELFTYLTTTLNKREYKDYTITLIGLEEWLTYENIELSSFDLLNVYLPVHNYTDYKDSTTIEVINKFIKAKEFHPSIVSLLAFDMAYYFGTCLKNYGSIINPVITNSFNHKGISINFNFKKTGIESGFENQSSFLIHYQNLELVRIH
ncbi:MAG: LysM peptidoglycan-binding domain-containing protein [Vicingaceae bacterium]|nr:LysM peptidoglycan-binding domain-containing protein [Vicingaceae bacterium]